MATFTIDTDKLSGGGKNPLWTRLLTILGVVGVVFYATGPILFPDAPIRQPELLPVYTLMMGLGQLLKTDGGQKEKVNGDDVTDNDK